LNIFSHRWQAGAPQPLPPAATSVPEPLEASPTESPAALPPADSTDGMASTGMASIGMIDTFESSCDLSSSGWQSYHDEATSTQISCAPKAAQAYHGASALQMDFDVPAGGWATCDLAFDDAQNWSAADGISFSLHAAQAGLVFNVDLYATLPDGRATYVYTIETSPESAAGWVDIALGWQDFQRVEWEQDAGAVFSNPEAIAGVAFGFTTYADANNTGTVWVDDLAVWSGDASPSAPEPTAIQSEPTAPAMAETLPEATAPATVAPASTPTDAPARGARLPCGSSFIAPLGAIGLAWFARRRRSGLR